MKISQIIVVILTMITAVGLNVLLDVESTGSQLLLGMSVGLVGALVNIIIGLED